MLSNIISSTRIKKTFQKSLLVSSIALLAACGSDDEAGFTSPVNDELVTLTADTSPITIDEGIEATYYENEMYGDDDRNVFDIWLPESSTPTGLIIFIHGGGFYAGDKTTAYLDYSAAGASINVENVSDINDVLAAGVAYATINYSLLDVPGFNIAATNDTEGLKKPLSDIREALQYIRYNATTFNIDPKKVATYGVSAGAVSSLWLAYSDDMIDVDSDDPVAQQSSRIAAAAAIETQGSLDLVRWDEILQSLGANLELAANIGGLPFMQSVYGISEDNDAAATLAMIRAESGELAEYRSTLDLPALIDASDAPVYLSSTWETYSATAQAQSDLESAESAEDAAAAQGKLIGAFLHFPTHANIIKQHAIEAGAEVVANIPELGAPDQTQTNSIEFLLGHLN